MRTRDLNDKMTIQTLTNMSDASGGVVKSYQTLAAVWVKAEPLGGSETFESDISTNTTRYRFTIHHRLDVNPTAIISFRNEEYDIDSVQMGPGREKWTIIEASQRTQKAASNFVGGSLALITIEAFSGTVQPSTPNVSGSLASITIEAFSGTIPQSTLWDLSDLTNIYEWWDGSPKDWKTGSDQSSSYITLNSGNVSNWAGREASIDIAQGTGADQPPYSGGIISFDSDSLATTAFASALTQPYTIVLVAEVTTGGTTRNLTDGIVSTNRAAIQYQTLNWILFSGSSASYGTSDLDLHVFVAEFNGASSRVYLDGTLLGTGDANTNSLTGLNLGSRWDGGLPLIGDIYQAAIVNEVMSTANRERVEGMLAHMVSDAAYYNNSTILTALPGGHTYKSSAPTV